MMLWSQYPEYKQYGSLLSPFLLTEIVKYDSLLTNMRSHDLKFYQSINTYGDYLSEP